MEKNLVTITGYLKENTLETFVSQKGQNAIRGNLIIATSSLESHKIQYYVSELTSKGEESKEYKNLLNLLPENTTSIADYLAANPDADFETAANAATKIWAAGYFDEFTRRNEEGEEITLIQVRGRRAGLKAPGADGKFETKAKFEVEVYISELTPEIDSNGAETGRYKLVGLLPNYDQSVNKITFIAPVQEGIADYIKNNYAVSNTTHINGKLVNIMNKVLVEAASANHFGSGGRDQYQTTFINERIIEGGDAKPLKDGEKDSITSSAAKMGLAKRENKIVDNSSYKKAAPPKANFGKASTMEPIKDEDIDF